MVSLRRHMYILEDLSETTAYCVLPASFPRNHLQVRMYLAELPLVYTTVVGS